MLLCEVDSLSDALSLGLLTPDELADQCSETQMAEKLKSLTNDTYHIQLDGKGLVLRIPGQGTDQIIDRSVEAAMLEMVKDLDITPEHQDHGLSGRLPHPEPRHPGPVRGARGGGHHAPPA